MPPIYDLKCDCGREEKDVLCGINEYPPCIKCGEPLKRVIGHYQVIGDLEPYLDENLTSKPVLVKSKKHRKELMKEYGVSEKFGKGWW